MHEYLYFQLIINAIECTEGNVFYSWNPSACLPPLPPPVKQCLPNSINVLNCECPDYQYFNKDTWKCEPCAVGNCKRCDDGPTSCTMCREGYNYLSQPAGGFACQPYCHKNCRTCSTGGDYTRCSRCHEGFFLFSTICDQCPKGYFGNANVQMCDSCHSSCQECNETATNCTICALGFYKQPYDPAIAQCEHPYILCKKECPEGYYGDPTDRVCKKCHPACQACIDPTNRCPTCSPNAFRLDDTCVFDCPLGYSINYGTKRCQLCHPDCEDCSGYTEKDCLKCADKHKYLRDKQCFLCDQSCFECNGPGPQNCISCPPGSVLTDGACPLLVCPDGFYADTMITKCVKCPDTCATCLSATKCLTCKDGYIVSNGLCVVCEEKKGYYTKGKVCDEICGDGLNLGMHECDDGNTIDGDGCSSRCTIEDGFKCYKGTSGADRCVVLTTAYVTIEGNKPGTLPLIRLVFNLLD